jgi:fumarate reductase iron-sulfur subunit
MLDPRDQRTSDEYFEVVGNEDGIFGCLGLLGCEDMCPKGIPLQAQLGMLRRKMGFSQVKHLFAKLMPSRKSSQVV